MLDLGPFTAFGTSDALLTVHAPDGTCYFASAAVSTLLGYSRAEFLGANPHALVHPDDRARLRDGHDRVLAGHVAHVVVRLRHANGHHVWVETTMHPIGLAAGAASARGTRQPPARADDGPAHGPSLVRPHGPGPESAAASDTRAPANAEAPDEAHVERKPSDRAATEPRSADAPVVRGGYAVGVSRALHGVHLQSERRARAALEERERWYRTLFQDAPVPMWCYDVATLRFVAVNEAAIAQYGWSREEFLQMTLLDVRPPSERITLLASIAARRAGAVTYRGVHTHWWKSGSLRSVEVAVHDLEGEAPARDARSTADAREPILSHAAGSSRGEGLRLAVLRDVTERRTADDERQRLLSALEQERTRLRAVLDALPIAVMVHDAPDGRVSVANAAAHALRAGAGVAGDRPGSASDRTPTQDIPTGEPFGPALRTEGLDGTWPADRVLAGDTVLGVEIALNGVPPAATPHGSASEGPPEEAPASSLARNGATGRAARWLRVSGAPLRDSTGVIVGAVLAGEDITLEKRLEARLRTAAQLEVVGQLAASVAHDFGNLLTVIKTGVALVRELLPAEHPASADLDDVADAATRGAALTRQLLGLTHAAPQSPVWQPVGPLLADLRRLIARLLPPGVELVVGGSGTDSTPDLEPAHHEAWSAPVRIDRVRFEQLVLNLVVNARDAMPDGGRLRIDVACVGADEVARARRDGVAPLRADSDHLPRAAAPTSVASTSVAPTFVRVRIEDTGIGMDAATLARAFEPFFTTKRRTEAAGTEATSGSGIGLATVATVVHEADGEIGVTSAVGVGTCVDVYLPSAPREVGPRVGPPVGRDAEIRAGALGATTPSPAAAPTLPGASPASSLAHRRVVLLAEDHPQVRRGWIRVLETDGHEVHACVDGEDALARWHALEDRVDLVLTDGRMPRRSGWALAGAIRAAGSDAPILLISGAIEMPHMAGDPWALADPSSASVSAEGPTARSLTGVTTLEKPITPAALREQVRATPRRVR